MVAFLMGRNSILDIRFYARLVSSYLRKRFGNLQICSNNCSWENQQLLEDYDDIIWTAIYLCHLMWTRHNYLKTIVSWSYRFYIIALLFRKIVFSVYYSCVKYKVRSNLLALLHVHIDVMSKYVTKYSKQMVKYPA